MASIAAPAAARLNAAAVAATGWYAWDSRETQDGHYLASVTDFTTVVTATWRTSCTTGRLNLHSVTVTDYATGAPTGAKAPTVKAAVDLVAAAGAAADKAAADAAVEHASESRLRLFSEFSRAAQGAVDAVDENAALTVQECGYAQPASSQWWSVEAMLPMYAASHDEDEQALYAAHGRVTRLNAAQLEDYRTGAVAAAALLA